MIYKIINSSKQYTNLTTTLENKSIDFIAQFLPEMQGRLNLSYYTEKKLFSFKIRKKLPNIKIYSLDSMYFDIEEFSNEELNELLNLIVNKNKHFDIIKCRKKNNLECNFNPIIIDTPNRNYEINNEIGIKEFIIKVINFFSSDINLHNFLNQLIKQELIVVSNEIKYNSCFCVDLPRSNKSVIYYENIVSNDEMLFNVAHEIGHAIFNFYKTQNRMIVDIELDEFAAYYFEYIIAMGLTITKKSKWIGRICDSINYNIVITMFQHELIKNYNSYLSLESKMELFKDICEKNKYNFDMKHFIWILRNREIYTNFLSDSYYIMPKKKLLQLIMSENVNNDFTRLNDFTRVLDIILNKKL